MHSTSLTLVAIAQHFSQGNSGKQHQQQQQQLQQQLQQQEKERQISQIEKSRSATEGNKF